MSGFEAVPAISLGMSILTSSYSLYRQMSDLGIIYNKAATINWNEGTIQQEWHVRRVSSANTKAGISHLFKKSKSLRVSNILPNTLQCIIFPEGTKDAYALDIISTESDILALNIRALDELLTSEMLVIRFSTRLDKRLYNGMCNQYHNRTPVLINSNYEFSFSVVLDRADLWMNEFKSLTFNNIVRTFEIHLSEEIIEQTLPQPLRKKILDYTKLARKEQKDALQFFNGLNNRLLSLNGNNNFKLFSAIQLESSAGSIELKSIRCGFNNYPIGEGFRIKLPITIFAEVTCSIHGRDHALTGKFIFKPLTYQKIISELF